MKILCSIHVAQFTLLTKHTAGRSTRQIYSVSGEDNSAPHQHSAVYTASLWVFTTRPKAILSCRPGLSVKGNEAWCTAEFLLILLGQACLSLPGVPCYMRTECKKEQGMAKQQGCCLGESGSSHENWLGPAQVETLAETRGAK